jgi:hypothetical protein
MSGMAKRPSPVSDLTEAERRAYDEELAESRRRLKRRVFIGLCIVAVPLYIYAAEVISAHNP